MLGLEERLLSSIREKSFAMVGGGEERKKQLCEAAKKRIFLKSV